MKLWVVVKDNTIISICTNRYIAYEKMKQVITNQPALGMLKVSFEKYQNKFGIGSNFYAEEREV